MNDAKLGLSKHSRDSCLDEDLIADNIARDHVKDCVAIRVYQVQDANLSAKDDASSGSRRVDPADERIIVACYNN